MTEVAIDPNVTESVSVACGSCKRRYRIKQAPRKAAPEMERYRKARAFAEEHGIEAAAAYSVLEGIMTLADARAGSAVPPAVPSPGTPAPARVTAPYLPSGGPEPSIPAAPPAPVGPAPAPPAPAPSAHTPAAIPAGTTVKMSALRVDERRIEEGPEYDDGFKAAVRDGCLTPQQATERGDHDALVKRLAQRHRLTHDLAAQVAENRITVHQALQRKTATEAQEVPRSQTSISHGVWNFTIATLGCLILLGAGARAWQEWEEYLTTKADAAQRPAIILPTAPAPPAQAPQGGTHSAPSTPSLTLPVTDAAGQIIMVTGPDPRSVLVAFCNTGHNAGRRQAFAISPASPPSGTARIGLFRNLEQPDAPMRAIRIRRDTRSGRWLSGDGHSPIQTEPAPDLSAGARLIPVSAGADLPESDQAPEPPPASGPADGTHGQGGHTL
jgi:hypothetical protein